MRLGFGKNRWIHGSLVVFLVLFLAPFLGTVFAADGPKSLASVPLGILLDEIPSDKDRAIYKTIQKSMGDQTSQTGAWQGLNDRHVVFVSSQDILHQAIRKNLSLDHSRLNAEQSRQAIDQADAVFDPIFSLTVNQSTTRTYHRSKMGQVLYKSFTSQDMEDGKQGVQLVNPNKDTAQVDKIGYGSQSSETVDEEIELSTISKGDPNTVHTGSLTIKQQLPWGPTVTLSQTTTRKRTFDETVNRNWENPWGTSLGASLWIPLPFSKSFGADSQWEVAQRQALISRDRGNLLVKEQLNTILMQVDLAYWDLVRSLENLLAAIENQNSVIERAKSAERLLKMGRITQYDKDQLDAESLRAQIVTEEGRQTLIQASYRLALLVEDDSAALRSNLLLPLGFDERLTSLVSVDAEAAVAIGLQRHPSLHIQKLDIESGNLTVALRHNQTLPDLSYSGSFSRSQDNSNYGYATLGKSMDSVIGDADSTSQSHTLSYSRPFHNRKLKAQLDSAKSRLKINHIGQHSLQDNVTKTIQDALGSLYSTQARIQTTEKNQALASLALESGKRRWKLKGDITSLELILKERNLFLARKSHITAKVDYKQAETRLGAAQGILAEQLAVQTAASNFDRYRIKMLSAQGDVSFFSPVNQTMTVAK